MSVKLVDSLPALEVARGELLKLMGEPGSLVEL
jgi:hypothetical protein